MLRRLFCAVLTSISLVSVSQAAIVNTTIWINEFHYDNVGGDVNEFVEIVAPSTYDVVANALTLTLYNGNGGGSYGTPVVGVDWTIGSTVDGFTFYSVAFPQNGIQNGGPDGMYLSDSTTGYQFLSYEGNFTAADGAADGLLSTDIGVAEPGSDAAGLSLQLVGVGNNYSSFSWQAPAATSVGNINVGQSITAIPEPSTYGVLAVLGLAGMGYRRRKQA